MIVIVRTDWPALELTIAIIRTDWLSLEPKLMIASIRIDWPIWTQVLS